MAGEDVRVAVAVHPEVVAAYTVAGEASAILLVRAETRATWRRLWSGCATTWDRRSRRPIVLSTLFERPFRP